MNLSAIIKLLAANSCLWRVKKVEPTILYLAPDLGAPGFSVEPRASPGLLALDRRGRQREHGGQSEESGARHEEVLLWLGVKPVGRRFPALSRRRQLHASEHVLKTRVVLEFV